MKWHIIFISLFLSFSVNLFCQSFYVNTMFNSLDPDNISTGYLLDRGVDYIGINQFDGTILTDDNSSTLFTFRNYLLTLNSARASSSIPQYDANAIVSNMMSGSGVTINIALFEHEYILPNALLDNKLVVQQNGVLQDYYEQGSWVNPYGVSRSLIFAPGKLIHDGLNVTYSIGNYGQIFSNIQSQIASIQFDAGDGNGYVSIGSAFPYLVSYQDSGLKELKVRVTLLNGSVLISHSSILISYDGTTIFNPTSDGVFYASVNSGYSQSGVSAIVTYKRASGNSSSIRKPLIYVEGFDDRVLGVLSSDSLPTLCKIARLLVYGEVNTLAYEMPESNSFYSDYDYFYVDWLNPREDIRANAELLEAIITQINNMKPNDGTAFRNVIMGHSMGGLVARYALCDMETKGIMHQTDYYISHDAPHLGANVPLGFQYAVRNIYTFIYGSQNTQGLFDNCFFKSVVDRVVGALDSKSARQMMYNYVSPSGSLNSSEHDSWINVLSQKGFPKGDPRHPIENIAIVNGGVETNPNSSLLSVQLNNGSAPLSNFSLLLRIFGLKNINLSIHAYPSTSSLGIVETDTLTCEKVYLWRANEVFSASHSHFSPSCQEYDYSPGSIFDDEIYSSDGIVAQKDFTFVPESSALSLLSGNNTHCTDTIKPLVRTPFSSFFLSNSRSRHMGNPYGMFSWLTNQLSISMSGPEGLALSGDSFTATGLGSYFSAPLWSVSDTCATISSSGILSVNNENNGRLIRVSYSTAENGHIHHKHKSILAGFPKMVLSRPQVIDITHVRVNASCVDPLLDAVLDSLSARGIISFAWGVEQTNGGIQWSVTSNRSHEFIGGYSSSVYMKILNGPGRESIEIHTPIDQFNDYLPYGFSPNIVLVSDDDVFFYYNDIQDPGYGTSLANSYAATWINTGYEQSTVPDNLYIDGQSIPVVSTTQQTINGQTSTLYCFNLLNSTKIQDGISSIRSGTAPPIGYIIRGYLRNGSTNLQQIVISMTEL